MSYAPENFTAWAEIPVTDMDKACAFYNAVFDTELVVDDSGPNPVAMFPTSKKDGVAGHLYPGKPAGDGSGPTIHLCCPDTLEATIARFQDAGGKMMSAPIAIPAGRFAYGIDLDGNSIGLFAHG